MKALSFLLLILAFHGTQPQPQQNASGSEVLAVVKFSWRRERLPGWEKPRGISGENYEAMRERVENERRIQQARNTGNNAEVGRREGAAKMLEDAATQEARKAERPRDGYRYKVVLANTGSKTVSLIDWDYLFLDPKTDEVVARHQFTSEENIKPGKTIRFALLPEGPAYFEPGVDSDQPLEWRIGELVREQALARTREEVPHAIAVTVDEVKPPRGKHAGRVTATLIVEATSQQGILVGKDGATIRAIGSAARPAIIFMTFTQPSWVRGICSAHCSVWQLLH